MAKRKLKIDPKNARQRTERQRCLFECGKDAARVIPKRKKLCIVDCPDCGESRQIRHDSANGRHQVPCQRCTSRRGGSAPKPSRRTSYRKVCERDNCDNEFATNPSAKQRYCSRQCSDSDPANAQQKSEALKRRWQGERTEMMAAIRKRSDSEEWKSAPHFQRGELHPRYKGNGKARREGISRYEYKRWRDRVYKRDGYTCTMCRTRGGKLVAHHIKPWATHLALRYDVDNGTTLCEDCHDKVHGLTRRKKNTVCTRCGGEKKSTPSKLCRRCSNIESAKRRKGVANAP